MREKEFCGVPCRRVVFVLRSLHIINVKDGHHRPAHTNNRHALHKRFSQPPNERLSGFGRCVVWLCDEERVKIAGEFGLADAGEGGYL